MAQVPLLSIQGPSQYPVIALVGSDGSLADLTSYVPAYTYEPFDASRLTAGETTIPRSSVTASTFATGNQSMRLTYFTAKKTETINSIRTITGGTAAATITLIRLGIYSVAANGDLTLVASTANDTSLFIAVSTRYTKALSAPFSKVAGTRYAYAVLIVATTTATFYGRGAILAAEALEAPAIAGVVPNLTDLPASVASASVVASNSEFYAAMVP